MLEVRLQVLQIGVELLDVLVVDLGNDVIIAKAAAILLLLENLLEL